MEIKDSPDLKVINLEFMPRGTGAKFLLTIKGQDGELVAKAWKRVAPKSLKPHEVLIRF